MKKLMTIFGAILFASVIFTSCGGKDCYECRNLSYWNGIAYTEDGDWFLECREDGENKEDYKKRMDKYGGDGWECRKKR